MVRRAPLRTAPPALPTGRVGRRPRAAAPRRGVGGALTQNAPDLRRASGTGLEHVVERGLRHSPEAREARVPGDSGDRGLARLAPSEYPPGCESPLGTHRKLENE